ncbi:hypothetical protein F896_03517 [Acinetobacter genomosp. 15BJ]|uniref:Uncharacterized protein n=1 Tax=Acinetobacter genomosp. 15BJ TaxID=106651 RepID=R9AMY3_9GAMM|nr:hypothetical protein F896_03517 [Acinetobacter genomosp. 15BJ]
MSDMLMVRIDDQQKNLKQEDLRKEHDDANNTWKRFIC